jgi:hypothetical protein
VTDVLGFECPRCATAVSERFYGPCASCREALRATMSREPAEEVGAARFEPKMNVVPNQVATKD